MAWGNTNERNMEQIAFISIDSEEKISETWKDFIYSHHFELQNDFYDSWIANHPRRTGEAHVAQYYDHEYLDNNPIPQDLDFPRLWAWCTQCEEENEDKSYKVEERQAKNEEIIRQNLLENEVILLKNAYDQINDMLNPSILAIQG